MQVKQKISVQSPDTSVDFDAAKADVGKIAKKVASAKTPFMKTKPPGTNVVLDVSNLSQENSSKVTVALSKVAGIDAKNSSLDVNAKQVTVKLARTGEAKLADIKKAVDDAVKSGDKPIDKPTDKPSSTGNLLTARGTIQALSTDNKDLTIVNKDGKEMKFRVDGDAKIKLNDKDAELSDIRDKDEATITYVKRDDLMVVKEIKLQRK